MLSQLPGLTPVLSKNLTLVSALRLTDHTGPMVSVHDDVGQQYANMATDHTDDSCIAWSCVGRRLTELGYLCEEMDMHALITQGIVSFWPPEGDKEA